MLLLDTHVWVTYFSDASKAAQLEELFRDKALYTSVLSISEFHLWALRNNVDSKKYLAIIEENSMVLGIDPKAAILAAQLRYNRKDRTIGLVDCLIYATALQYGLSVVTGDPDFKQFKHTIFV